MKAPVHGTGSRGRTWWLNRDDLEAMVGLRAEPAASRPRRPVVAQAGQSESATTLAARLSLLFR